jgi:large exoprotein involved in heme utilization and adhesion
VEIGGLTETGTVNISENGGLTFPNIVARGDILFTNSSGVIVYGEDKGSIFVNAKNLELNSSSVLLAGIISDPGFANAQAGDIIINATEDVLVNGKNDIDTANSSISNSVFAGGVGNAGKIEISAKNISIINGGFISSIIDDNGNTSNINLTATENIIFDGIGVNESERSGILNNVNATGIGDVGDINLTAKNFFIKNRAYIDNNVSGIGNSGNVNINVSDTVSIDGSLDFIYSAINSQVFFGQGDSGNINIEAKNLFLTNGGQLSVDIFDGKGNAGDVNIQANQILIDGANSAISSEIISSSFFGLFAEGNGGNINIKTDSLSISNQGLIEADLSFDSLGNAGNININTSKLFLNNQGLISVNTFGNGNAGNLTINADLIEVKDNSIIL